MIGLVAFSSAWHMHVVTSQHYASLIYLGWMGVLWLAILCSLDVWKECICMLLHVAVIAWRSTCWLPLLTSVLDFGCALDICLLHMAFFVSAGSLLFYCGCRSRLILQRLATCFDDHRLGGSSIQFLVVIGLAWLAFGWCLFPVSVISCKIYLWLLGCYFVLSFALC